MTTVGRYIPIYDAWSNEGGGRAIEEGIRYGERKALEKLRKDGQPSIEGADRAKARYTERLQILQAEFIERYGADALANKDTLLQGSPNGTMALSPEGSAMLADLAKLERERIQAARATELIDKLSNTYRRLIDASDALAAARQNEYDSRFERDDNKRADAYERAEVARGQLRDLAARGAEWNAQSARRAGEVAASMSSSAALFASTKLFEFGRNGSVRIDAGALANMGTTEAATAELARLIGALTERNGLGQLRDTLIGALNGQNRRIASLVGEP